MAARNIDKIFKYFDWKCPVCIKVIKNVAPGRMGAVANHWYRKHPKQKMNGYYTGEFELECQCPSKKVHLERIELERADGF